MDSLMRMPLSGKRLAMIFLSLRLRLGAAG
jgi:hypothetical protein